MLGLVFVPLVGFWAWMCWVVSRPKANYVGVAPSQLTIATRGATRVMRVLIVAFTEPFQSSVRAATQAIDGLAAAVKRLPRGVTWPPREPL